MSYQIRDLDESSEHELDTVTRMCMKTVLDTIPEFEHDEEIARRALPNFTFSAMRDMIRADFRKPTHRFFVVVDDCGRVVGHSMVSRKVTPQGRRFGHFFSRYVEPEHRRKGLGSRLMDAALAWFDDYDWEYLLAHTHEGNLRLRALFERHGFVVVERQNEPWPSVTLRRDRRSSAV
jgi:GNAT superfamily N-acetyltransferase